MRNHTKQIRNKTIFNYFVFLNKIKTQVIFFLKNDEQVQE